MIRFYKLFINSEFVVISEKDIVKQTLDNFMTTFCQNCWGWGYHLKGNDIDDIKKQVESFYTEGKPVLQASLPIKVDVRVQRVIF